VSRLIGFVICILVFSLTGCDQQDEPATNAATGSRVPDDNVFKHQVRALEKAEDAQKTLNDAAMRQRTLIEEQAQ
jgi:ABC-type uncharacterized transport system auxiliary subunit